MYNIKYFMYIENSWPLLPRTTTQLNPFHSHLSYISHMQLTSYLKPVGVTVNSFKRRISWLCEIFNLRLVQKFLRYGYLLKTVLRHL